MPPRLFYVHGSGYTEDSFRAQLDSFADSDALSLPGHPQGEPLASVTDLAEWLDSYIRWTRAEKAVVAGNSLGGAIAMEWALRHPDRVAGLILIGTGARLRVGQAIMDMLDRWPESIPTFAEYAVSSGAPQALRSRVEQWHRTVGQKSTRADYMACNAFDVMPRLSEITAPTLIIVGAEDALTPPKYARYLHEHLAGSRLLEVPAAGHIVMAERPDAVNAAIAEFLTTTKDR